MNRIVTPFVKPKLSRIKREPTIIKEEITRNRLRHLIKRYSEAHNPIFTNWLEPETNKVASLLYLGKLPGCIRANYSTPDLANLVFLYNLNRVAKQKKLYFYIVYENEHFDKYHYEIRYREENVIVTRKLVEALDLDRIKLINFQELVEKELPCYMDKFLECSNRIKVNKRNKQIRESFYIDYYSYACNNILEGVKLYYNKAWQLKIKNWAWKVTSRYICFIEARKQCGFWNKLKELGFSRATVSHKEGVISINPIVGGIVASHGVSVIENRQLKTRYYIELATSERLMLYYYRDYPMFYEINY